MGNDNGQQGTDPTEAARQAVATERQRVSDITALCRQAGMDPAEYISNGATMDTVRHVSYTHLDVYKRQNYYNAALDKILENKRNRKLLEEYMARKQQRAGPHGRNNRP